MVHKSEILKNEVIWKDLQTKLTEHTCGSPSFMERDGLTNKTMCIKEFELCEWIMKSIIQETQNEQLIFKYEKRNAEKKE